MSRKIPFLTFSQTHCIPHWLSQSMRMFTHLNLMFPYVKRESNHQWKSEPQENSNSKCWSVVLSWRLCSELSFSTVGNLYLSVPNLCKTQVQNCLPWLLLNVHWFWPCMGDAKIQLKNRSTAGNLQAWWQMISLLHICQLMTHHARAALPVMTQVTLSLLST